MTGLVPLYPARYIYFLCWKYVRVRNIILESSGKNVSYIGLKSGSERSTAKMWKRFWNLIRWHKEKWWKFGRFVVLLLCWLGLLLKIHESGLCWGTAIIFWISWNCLGRDTRRNATVNESYKKYPKAFGSRWRSHQGRSRTRWYWQYSTSRSSPIFYTLYINDARALLGKTRSGVRIVK